MHLLLLSRQRWLYSTRRFRESAWLRAHDLSIADPLECALAIDDEGRASSFRADRWTTSTSAFRGSAPRCPDRGSPS